MIHTYSKYNSTLYVQVLDDGGPPIYKLEHVDILNAPNAIFYTKGGQTSLMFDFHSLCITEKDWPEVKEAVDAMRSLWCEYKSLNHIEQIDYKDVWKDCRILAIVDIASTLQV